MNDQPDQPEPLAAVKYGPMIPVSLDMLMNEGLIPDTRPPAPPAPWRRRLRSRISSAVWRARTRISNRIAGRGPDDECDCW